MRALALVVLALVPAAAAATPSRVVDSDSVGAYQFGQSRSRALDVFGAPTYSADSQRFNLPQPDTIRCGTYWSSLRLEMQFEGSCSLAGRVRMVRVREEFWRTREGLRIGNTVRRLQQLYRGARLTPIPSGATLERWGVYPRGREWDLRRARPSSNVIVITQGNVVTGFELRLASLR